MIGMMYHSDGYKTDVWKNMIASFGIDRVIRVDNESMIDDINKNSYFHYVFLIPTDEITKDMNVTKLQDFQHESDNICYVFGRNNGGFTEDEIILGMNNLADFVTLGTNINLELISVPPIVFYDRVFKLRQPITQEKKAIDTKHNCSANEGREVMFTLNGLHNPSGTCPRCKEVIV